MKKVLEFLLKKAMKNKKITALTVTGIGLVSVFAKTFVAIKVISVVILLACVYKFVFKKIKDIFKDL